MADEPPVDERTFKEKLLFYTTAFFILLGTFSLFAFLFLVPFVIDPAFTTIFMQFDTNPAICTTVDTMYLRGASNCSWTSCREGCTKDIYECLQISVNYRLMPNGTNFTGMNLATLPEPLPEAQALRSHRRERAIREYDYADSEEQKGADAMNGVAPSNGIIEVDYSDLLDMDQGEGNESEWFFTMARLYPNVKGCGYPPSLNCSIWTKAYKRIGTNFTCYYSKVDPKLVITHLDMRQNTLNLIYSMAIPIPSFIISVIYLTIAYFKIYNEDEEAAPLDKNAEGMAGEGEDVEGGEPGEEEDGVVLENGTAAEGVSSSLPNGTTPLTASGALLSSNTDIASFGHQLKVKMADEMSRESIDGGLLSTSASFQGNLSKTMTTSISTPPGPIAAV
ncbi:protein tipE isoform X1 [Phlebotomus argentipes]|uniref:protein tipE isoform X1 n=1 Tax=Phlebotomus argentipes TaxID=94469 RepID=UPI0028929840|nr:protein tipE isoform X1 [Phlebotomus argentipes]XP_059613566.1 protein tipE isoform X1 [Phlebotomus argentipes]